MKLKSHLGTVGLAVALIGCANPHANLAEQANAAVEEGKRTAAETEAKAKARREAYAQAHPEYGRWILNQQVAIGMSTDDLIASWGPPANVNKTVTAYGINEQWVYYYMSGTVPPGVINSYAPGMDTFYVYFANGRVSSWQQSQ